jgi:two-component system sensor histidine kinase BaeS
MYRRFATLVPRLSITLADGRVLLEPRLEVPDHVRQLQQLVEVEGVVVARLQLLPAREIARERDRRFSREHLAAIWWIAAAAAALASLVGWLLARRLVVPVQAVAAGARALAAGRHDIVLPENRGDELGALARDFNRLASTLAATARARERWMADVAHELRTPVAVLRGEIDALRDGVRSPTPEALESLDAEVGRLAGLIDDLHDLTLADAGALAHRFEEADLAALVDDACRRFGDRLADAGLDLQWTRPTAPAPVRADPRRLEQLLANLLENAVRYTDRPGPVRVTVTAEDGRVHLCVEDGPPGVDEAERGRLFERFHRVEASRARASGGAGLGLAIAERIVRAHDGTIEARASELGGVAIDVELPREGPAA